jgi:LacI family transcriptional regulator
MATIHDVAHHAGVSATTVSRYLNNRIYLPSRTSERIDAAIRALEYRPNVMAKRLSTGRTDTVGIVVPDIREPVLAEVTAGIESEAVRQGYSVYLCTTRRQQAREIAAIERLLERHVDGLIMMTETADDGTLAELIGSRQKIVLLGEDIAGIDAPRLFLANAEGAYAATRHLIEAGHRAIGFVGGPDELTSVLERREGYEQALREAAALRPTLIRSGSYAAEFARQAVTELLEAADPPTALLAASDSLVVGTLVALRQRGLRIPDDISVVGFDGAARTLLLYPELTTVQVPLAALGRQAFRSLHELMGGGEPPSLREPLELVRRGSVGPPRG